MFSLKYWEGKRIDEKEPQTHELRDFRDFREVPVCTQVDPDYLAVICVDLGFPSPAVKLPESQTRLVIPAVNILGRNSRPLLPTRSPETRPQCLCACVHTLPLPPSLSPRARTRDPGAMTRR